MYQTGWEVAPNSKAESEEAFAKVVSHNYELPIDTCSEYMGLSSQIRNHLARPAQHRVNRTCATHTAKREGTLENWFFDSLVSPLDTTKELVNWRYQKWTPMKSMVMKDGKLVRFLHREKSFRNYR